jgi:hypothetical protein
MSNNFEMKDLGEANVILNVKLSRDSDGGVTLLQSHYVEKVLSALVIVIVYLHPHLMILVFL